MATSIAYNLANLALSTSSTSNVNVAVFGGNVTTVQYINAGNIQTGNMSLGGSLVISACTRNHSGCDWHHFHPG